MKSQAFKYLARKYDVVFAMCWLSNKNNGFNASNAYKRVLLSTIW